MLVVHDEHGSTVETGRWCPSGRHDLARAGLINVTTAQLMCGVDGDRWLVPVAAI